MISDFHSIKNCPWCRRNSYQITSAKLGLFAQISTTLAKLQIFKDPGDARNTQDLIFPVCSASLITDCFLKNVWNQGKRRLEWIFLQAERKGYFVEFLLSKSPQRLPMGKKWPCTPAERTSSLLQNFLDSPKKSPPKNSPPKKFTVPTQIFYHHTGREEQDSHF